MMQAITDQIQNANAQHNDGDDDFDQDELQDYMEQSLMAEATEMGVF